MPSGYVAPQPGNQAAPQPNAGRPPSNQPFVQPQFAEMPNGERPVLDSSVEKTTIKITLSTGQATTLDLNMTHTVADIRTFVSSVNPSVPNYQLVRQYPPGLLNNPAATVAEA